MLPISALIILVLIPGAEIERPCVLRGLLINSLYPEHRYPQNYFLIRLLIEFGAESRWPQGESDPPDH